MPFGMKKLARGASRIAKGTKGLGKVAGKTVGGGVATKRPMKSMAGKMSMMKPGRKRPGATSSAAGTPSTSMYTQGKRAKKLWNRSF